MISDFVRVYVDKIVPKRMYRWIFAGTCFFAYLVRIYYIGRFYLLTYCLSLYLLHAFIVFLTPKNEEIPDIFDDVDTDFEIPVNIDNEFRPFIRRLPEFQFWLLFLKMVGGAFVLTFFRIFNIHAHVTILFIYFGVIVALTIRNLLKHMKKYNYNPFFEKKTQFRAGQ